MSDVILERLAKAAEGILAHIQKSPVFGLPVGGAVPPKGTTATTGGAPDAAAKAKADAAAKAKVDAAAKAKAEADAKAKATAAAPKPTAGPAPGTKGPNGKFTVEQVREKIREVATNASLGRQTATDILDADGGGVKKITDLKPENYDKVYEACQVALQGEGSSSAASASPEDDLM